VPETVRECYGAGIRVIMITGDYPVRAQSIAREIGLNNPETYILGSDLDMMNPEELKEK